MLHKHPYLIVLILLFIAFSLIMIAAAHASAPPVVQPRKKRTTLDLLTGIKELSPIDAGLSPSASALSPDPPGAVAVDNRYGLLIGVVCAVIGTIISVLITTLLTHQL